MQNASKLPHWDLHILKKHNYCSSPFLSFTQGSREPTISKLPTNFVNPVGPWEVSCWSRNDPPHQKRQGKNPTILWPPGSVTWSGELIPLNFTRCNKMILPFSRLSEAIILPQAEYQNKDIKRQKLSCTHFLQLRSLRNLRAIQKYAASVTDWSDNIKFNYDLNGMRQLHHKVIISQTFKSKPPYESWR